LSRLEKTEEESANRQGKRTTYLQRKKGFVVAYGRGEGLKMAQRKIEESERKGKSGKEKVREGILKS